MPMLPALPSGCLVAKDRSVGVCYRTGQEPTRARLGPRLVHMPLEPSGSQRSPAVSSGRSFAQVAGTILGKQARGQNPDKDEVPGSSPGRLIIQHRGQSVAAGGAFRVLL
jgi:hypothetical protein